MTCKCNCVVGGDTLKNHQTLTENTRLLTENITLRRELENERARDIHSCGPDCTRYGCVNRRLRDELAEKDDEIESYRTSYESAHEQNLRISKQLGESEAQIIRLRKQLTEKDAEIERLKSKAIDHEVKHDVAVCTLDRVKSDRAVLQKALAAQCAETKEFRQQLAEKDAEIERLRGMVDEIQAARHVHREHNRLLTNLASSQAREPQLREALRVAGMNCVDDFIAAGALQLADTPVDTTALSAMITKAGEVMRERSVGMMPNMTVADLAHVRRALRTLPAVTLDDLK